MNSVIYLIGLGRGCARDALISWDGIGATRMANLDDNSSPTGGSNETVPSMSDATREQLKGAEMAFEETSTDLSEMAGELAGDLRTP